MAHPVQRHGELVQGINVTRLVDVVLVLLIVRLPLSRLSQKLLSSKWSAPRDLGKAVAAARHLPP
jgi:biopolymer transport protein ExbD